MSSRGLIPSLSHPMGFVQTLHLLEMKSKSVDLFSVYVRGVVHKEMPGNGDEVS